MWASIEEIVEDLSLNSNPEDIEGIKKELKKLRQDLHPDKNGGSFEDREHKEHYEKIQLAIGYIDGLDKLIPVSSIPAIVSEISKALSVSEKGSNVGVRISEARYRNFQLISDRLKFPKISLTVVSSFLALIFFFPQQIAEHPFLGNLVYNTYFFLFWSEIVLLVSIFWFLIWISENRQKKIVNTLLSRDFQNNVFEKISHREAFPRGELMRAFHSEIRRPVRRNPFIPRPFDIIFGKVDSSIIENSVDIAIERYLNNGWIKTAPPKKFRGSYRDEFYEVMS